MTTSTTAASAPATALKPRMDHWSVAPALMQGLLDLQIGRVYENKLGQRE